MTAQRKRLDPRAVNRLFGKAAGLCSFTACRASLVESDDGSFRVIDIAEVGHMVANSPTGPRGADTPPEFGRDDETNLILLCPNHHTLVDKMPVRYTLPVLREMKTSHERWVRESLQKAMVGVTQVQLEAVARYLAGVPAMGPPDFHLIPPQKKLDKNGLSASVREQLTLGIPRSKEVARFLATEARTDPDFPDQLKAGFTGEYARLWQSGLRGDDLFRGLYHYATRGSREFNGIAAGLAILAYLFEACEVFAS